MTRRFRILPAFVVVCLFMSLTGAVQAAPAPATCAQCAECPAVANGVRVVRVKVYNQSRLSDANLTALLDVSRHIWLRYGVAIEPVTSLDAVTVVMSGDQRRPAAIDGRSVLGETLFTRNHATPYIRLWLGAAEHVAAVTPTGATPFNMLPDERRESTLAQMMGVALAHELGHYLLDTEKHSTRGLLQAAISVRELQHPVLGRLELTRSQQQLMCSAAQTSARLTTEYK